MLGKMLIHGLVGAAVIAAAAAVFAQSTDKGGLAAIAVQSRTAAVLDHHVRAADPR